MASMTVLDGLAWAGMPERARVAKIAAMLIRKADGDPINQTDVRHAVRETSPPYGRAKYVFQALIGVNDAGERWVGEIEAQKAVYSKRQYLRKELGKREAYRALREARLNYAYAARFDRPAHALGPMLPFEDKWDWSMGHDDPARQRNDDWHRKERARDKGDECRGLTHQGDHVVCLVTSVNVREVHCIKTRCGQGEIVTTYLRDRAENLAEAAVSLGGPKVLAAIARGKRVKTDWVGRRSFIYHDGSDHENPKVEEIPWRALATASYPYHDADLVLVHGDTVRPEV